MAPRIIKSVYIRVISVLVVIERMKRVWKPRLEIRAQTIKTRVNLVPRSARFPTWRRGIDLSDLFAYGDFFTG